MAIYEFSVHRNNMRSRCRWVSIHFDSAWSEVAHTAVKDLMSRIVTAVGILVISLVISSSMSRAGSIQEAKTKQYTYTVNGKNLTVDFPIFVEGSDKKVTKDVFHGYQLYNSYCFRCHGTDATESALAPDLRRFAAALPKKEFLSVAMAGREDKGMPSWAGFLSEEEIQQIYQYVKGRSLELVPAGRPPSDYD
jgi:cytochrome c